MARGAGAEGAGREGAWARARAALGGLTANAIKSKRAAFEEVRQVLEDARCCEQITAANGALAHPSAWAVVCEDVLCALESLLSASRGQNVARASLGPVSVLQKAVQCAEGAAGLRSADLADQILGFCVDNLDKDDHFEELGGVYVQIVRHLLGGVSRHRVSGDLVKRVWKLCARRLEALFDEERAATQTASADPGAPLAEILLLSLRSARFGVSSSLQTTILAHIHRWILPDDANARAAQLKTTIQHLLDVVNAFIEVRGRSFFPIIAAYADLVPVFVARNAYSLPPTSPLRVSALRCLHSQLALFAARASSFGAEAADPFGQGSDKGPLLEKTIKIACDLFGSLPRHASDADESPSKRIQEIVSAYSHEVDKPGLQAHLTLAVDLIFWLHNANRTDHGLPSVPQILNYLRNAPIGARHLEYQTIAWVQVLTAYVARHPTRGWQAEDDAHLGHLINVLAQRLADLPGTSREIVWILRCCAQLARDQEGLRREHLWEPVWSTLIARTLPKLQRAADRDVGLELLSILLCRDMVDSASSGAAIELVCTTCDIALESDLCAEDGDDEPEAVDPTVPMLDALTSLLRGGSLPEPQDKRIRTTLLRWALNLLPSRRVRAQTFLEALASLLLALTSRKSPSWAPACLSGAKEYLANGGTTKTTLISRAAEEATQRIACETLDSETQRIVDALAETASQRDSASVAALVRQAAQLAYIVGRLGEVNSDASSLGYKARSLVHELLELTFTRFAENVLGSREQRAVAAALAANSLLTSLDDDISARWFSGPKDPAFPAKATNAIIETLSAIRANHQVLFETDVAPTNGAGDLFASLENSRTKRRRIDGSEDQQPGDSGSFGAAKSSAQQASSARGRGKGQKGSSNDDDDEYDSDDDGDDDNDFADEFGMSNTSQQSGLSNGSHNIKKRAFSRAQSSEMSPSLSLHSTANKNSVDAGYADPGQRVELRDALAFARDLVKIVSALLSAPAPRLNFFRKLVLADNETNDEDRPLNGAFAVMCVQALGAHLEATAELMRQGKLDPKAPDQNDVFGKGGFRLILAAANDFEMDGDVLVFLAEVLARIASVLARLPFDAVRSPCCVNAAKAVMEGMLSVDDDNGSAYFVRQEKAQDFMVRSDLRNRLPRASQQPMPEEAQVKICEMIVSLAELWLVQKNREGSKIATYVIFHSCVDVDAFALRARAAEIGSPLLSRLKRKSMLNVLYGFIGSFKARKETLRGLRSELPMVDTGVSKSDDEGNTCEMLVDDDDNDEEGYRSLDSIDALAKLTKKQRKDFVEHLWADEMVWSNWNLLARIACASAPLVRPVLFRFAVFAAVNSSRKDEKGHGAECAVLRRSFLRALVREIGLAHDCPNIFIAQSEFLLMNWARYGPWASPDPLRNFPCSIFDMERARPKYFDLVANWRTYVGLLLHRGIDGGDELVERLKRLYKVKDVSLVMRDHKWEFFGYLGALPSGLLWEEFSQHWQIPRQERGNLVPQRSEALRYALDLVSMPDGGFGPFRGLSADDVVSFSNREFSSNFFHKRANAAEILVHLNMRAQLSLAATLPALRCFLECFSVGGVLTTQPIALAMGLDLVLYVLRRAQAGEATPSRDGDANLLDQGLECLGILSDAGIDKPAGQRVMARHALAVVATVRDLLLACPDQNPGRRTKLSGLRAQWVESLAQEVPEVRLMLQLLPGTHAKGSLGGPASHGSNESRGPLGCLVDAFGTRYALHLLLRMNPTVYMPVCLLILGVIDTYLENTETALQDPMLGPATLVLGALLHEVPSEVREMAAGCLGAIGCIDKSLADLYHANVDLERARKGSYDGVHEIVAYLASAVRSPDVATSSAALQALRCIGVKKEEEPGDLDRFADLTAAYREKRIVEQVHLDSHLATTLVWRSLDALFEGFPAEKKSPRNGSFRVCERLWKALDSPYAAWVQRLAFALCNNSWDSEDEPLQYCRELAAVDAHFARLVLPRLVSRIVESGDKQTVGHLGQIFSATLDNCHEVPEDKLRVMLEALAFTRRRYVEARAGKRKVLQDSLALCLDPISVSRAALRCEMPTTALLYLEHFSTGAPAGVRAELTFEAYQKLGSIDDLDGIGLSNAHARLHFAKRNWLTALVGADGILVRGNVSEYESRNHAASPPVASGTASSSMMMSGSMHAHASAGAAAATRAQNEREILTGTLRNLGLYHLLDMVSPDSAESEWRVGRTRQSFDRTLNWRSLDVVFSEALRAMRSKSETQLKGVLKLGTLEATRRMASSIQSGECSQTVYENLRLLQQLRELGRGFELASRASLTETVASWDRELVKRRHLRFEHGEPLMTLRTSLLLANKADSKEHVVAASYFARKQGKPEIAHNVLLWYDDTTASRDGAQQVSTEFTMERASVMWDSGEFEAAIKLCTQAIEQHEERGAARSSALTLSRAKLLGTQWCTDLSYDTSDEICKGYEEAAQLAMQAKDEEQEAACRTAWARYLDHLYRTLHARIESREWTRMAASQTKLEEQHKRAKEAYTAATGAEKKELSRLVQQLNKVVEPANERRREEAMVLTYLKQTAEQLRRAIVLSAATPLSFVFRLLGLWFNHLDNEAVAEEAMKVPSVRLLPLAYQIASRVGFNAKLDELLVRLARDEPFETYPHIFALAKGDYIPNEQRLRKYAAQNQAKLVSAKTAARQAMAASPAVQALDSLLSALTELAYHVKSGGRGQRGRPSNDVPLVTTDCAGFKANFAAYRRSKERVPLLASHELVEDVAKNFSHTVSGINVPKIVTLIMTNGTQRRILLKGTDDLRQDAITEQLFGLVEHLLREARLSIRTYKVVPLTPVAGLIEWVENTLPLASYLVSTSPSDTTSAHLRYKDANGLTHLICMHRMMSAHNGARAAGKRTKSPVSSSGRTRGPPSKNNVRKVFDEVCEHFKPVMRFFFLEKFSSPPEWHMRRKVYTQSVAVNSMVGHIFGVGDRHLQNILIDQATAELVHIDFGVLFEFGKTLSTPERVPFRLTRDLVNGMPAGSTAGTFEKTCERTMSILRDHHELITTICDVLVHDPIYNWTVRTKAEDADGDGDGAKAGMPVTAAAVSVDDEEPNEERDDKKNEVAENVLARIREKLHGREDPGGESLNVKGHVRRLIQQAQDPDNLAHMFHGWASWV